MPLYIHTWNERPLMMPAIDSENPVWFTIAGRIPRVILNLLSMQIFRVTTPVIQIKYLALVFRTFWTRTGMTVDLYQVTPGISYPGVLNFLGCASGRISHSHIHIGFWSPLSPSLIYERRNSLIIQLSDAPSNRLLSRLNAAYHSSSATVQNVPCFLCYVTDKTFVFLRCLVQHDCVAHIQRIFRLFSEAVYYALHVLALVNLYSFLSQPPSCHVSESRFHIVDSVLCCFIQHSFSCSLT